jgi:hypothetical protein
MAVTINSDADAHLLQTLGENPHVDALADYAQQVLGNVPLSLLDMDDTVRYVVTLYSEENQDNFYDEMESAGTRGYTPTRVVECAERMPTLRSTTYLLSTVEAAHLELDPRVMAVELHPEVSGIKPRPLGYEYSANWDKGFSTTSDMKNWGLLRATNRAQIPGWGYNDIPNIAAEIVTTSTGKNVDCVVFDGNVLPGHPEYAVNVDGTGGSRVNQINWWAYNPQVTGQAAGTYNYSAGTAGNNGHGMHVAGIMCGNTQGWARDSTIYNISPYGEQTNGTTTPTLAQLVAYIRYWHNSVKGINPATGRKNPTVVNMSFGIYGNQFGGIANNGTTFPYCNSIVYRGVTTSYPSTTPAGQNIYQQIYNSNWRTSDFLNNGVSLYYPYVNAYDVALFFYTGQDTAAAQAILDSIDANEGIIWCAAAGNNWDSAGMNANSLDYNNTHNQLTGVLLGIVPIYATRYTWRLSSPGWLTAGTPYGADWRKVIVTANVGPWPNERLDESSSAGSMCDFCNPGTNIMSAYNSAGVSDPRNAAYYLTKLTGTSMSSPQTAGQIACMMEQYPNTTQMQAREYLMNFANSGVMFDSNIQCPPNNPIESLRGAPNLISTYYPDRPPTGNPWPQARSWLRPASGAVYPRPTIQRRNINF